MRRAIAVTAAMEERWLGLRVENDNVAAMSVYRSLGLKERKAG
jgi:ribosomal protein S18 acetylase RimI-like enzyme